MRKTYAEKRYFDYREDEICGALRANSGSLGGGGGLKASL